MGGSTSQLTTKIILVVVGFGGSNRSAKFSARTAAMREPMRHPVLERVALLTELEELLGVCR